MISINNNIILKHQRALFSRVECFCYKGLKRGFYVLKLPIEIYLNTNEALTQLVSNRKPGRKRKVLPALVLDSTKVMTKKKIV